MESKKYSFMDIFHTVFKTGNDAVELNRIEIPMIQRDYAQGREEAEVRRVRERFLDSLLKAVMEEPITLDFVYGDIREDGVLIPLDGQQRLTTLFLLHWYAAKKADLPEEDYAFLNEFSYATRYSARDFCSFLVKHIPSFTKDISQEIINQAWFPLDWKKDPTISSMLVMLDAIDAKFKNIDDLWERLAGQAITFYFLPIKDMGLTDELYIKMNSRGKPLTRFEHFKAEFLKEIRSLDKEKAKEIGYKIDLQWTDLLWQYRDSGKGLPEDDVTDDEFLRYFKFICDIIAYHQGKSLQGVSMDEFDLIQMYFSASDEASMQNVEYMEACFDCWCDLGDYDNPTQFLHKYMSHEHESGKILIEERNKIDIFEDCLHSYSDRSGRTRQFPLNRIILLYSVVYYLCNKDVVSEEQFTKRLRMINNLIQNSVDEVSDRTDRNRIPAILKQVDSLMMNGILDESIENGFNVNQLQEEKEKAEYLLKNPDREGDLATLEDHPMLRGQISILGLENLDLADRFRSLFTCQWDKIDCALMAIGNYGQKERNGWRYQYGSKSRQSAWDGLFHKSANAGFEKTKGILRELLQKKGVFNDETLDEIINNFLLTCEGDHTFPWRYYYVKYPVFRPGSFGKLSNSKAQDNPYLYSVMQTRSFWSNNTYMPYLKAADEGHLSRESFGQKLVYKDRYITCENARYCIKKLENDEILEIIDISQNEEGTDVEDRILKLRNYIDNGFIKDWSLG